MIKIENFEVVGWEHAIRGMRNPMNSWAKSDSLACCEQAPDCGDCPGLSEDGQCNLINSANYKSDPFVVGPNDHECMMKLRKAGPDHRKYMRYIEVYVDITAPLYWWKEFKTYRHGRKFMDDEDFFDYDDELLEMHIEMNSCSTMHKIHEKEFTEEDFSFEDLKELPWDDCIFNFKASIYETIGDLNIAREMFLKTKDPRYFRVMIQLLPSAYNQKRTVKMNYECLARMYRSRRKHKLIEWRELCKWIESLPYSEIITGVKTEELSNG